jgi:hypothetical protein
MGEQLTAEGPNQWQREYASTHVYGLDFDPRAVKIAKALNLIAGDGRTNVYRANSLAPICGMTRSRWDCAIACAVSMTNRSATAGIRSTTVTSTLTW